jgi:antitoxin component YwqK of YwqJK toxin-antitoxin module
MKEYYQTLGLQDNATQEEIEIAFKRLSKELHPRNNDNQEFFIEEYKKVQEAYAALSNSSILATEKCLNAANVKPKVVAQKKHLSNAKNTIPSKSRLKKIFGIAALLVVVFLFFVYVILQPQKYKIDEVVFNNDIAYLKHDMSLLNGKVTDSLYDGLFVNGRKEGLIRKWHRNGQLKHEVNYVNGQEEGLERNWYDNGQLKHENNYVNGVREGFSRQWFENGQLKEEGNFKNNRYHGNWAFYHKNGNKHAIGAFNESDGKGKGSTGIPNTNREGIWYLWYDNGQLEQEGKYVTGKREGLSSQWHENGQLDLRGSFVNGKQEGLWPQWNEKGNLVMEHNFVNGVNQNTKYY